MGLFEIKSSTLVFVLISLTCWIKCVFRRDLSRQSCLHHTVQPQIKNTQRYWHLCYWCHSTFRSPFYRITAELPAQNSTPSSYNFTGKDLSYVWADSAYYVPSERSWIKYPENRSIPPGTKRDSIDFQSEDQWVDFVRNRDQPAGTISLRVWSKSKADFLKYLLWLFHL